MMKDKEEVVSNELEEDKTSKCMEDGEKIGIHSNFLKQKCYLGQVLATLGTLMSYRQIQNVRQDSRGLLRQGPGCSCNNNLAQLATLPQHEGLSRLCPFPTCRWPCRMAKTRGLTSRLPLPPGYKKVKDLPPAEQLARKAQQTRNRRAVKAEESRKRKRGSAQRTSMGVIRFEQGLYT